MIDLNPSPDQRQILDAAAAMLAADYPLDRLRGPGPERLEAVAAFGALGLTLPEEAGGAGFAPLDEVLLHVAFGRHLLSPAVLAGALAARLALALGQQGLAARLASGAARAALAHAGEGALTLLDPAGAEVAVAWRGGAIRLYGLARIQPLAGIDETLPLGRAAPAPVLGAAEGPIARHGDLLVAAQLLGIAEAARDLAVDYAKTRQQFGQPIGAFQAIKHHAANMALKAEIAAAQLDLAALAEGAGLPDAPFQTAAARHLAQEAAIFNARTGIQIHGGIGFSAESAAHLFLKRAHALALIGGGADLLALAAPLTPTRES